MCVYARFVVRAARCTVLKDQYQKELRQQRSKRRSRIVRSQLPPPPVLSDSIIMASGRGSAFAACSLEPPRLWIHIQDVTHKSLAVAVVRCLATLMLDGAAISPQPVQVASDGPLVDEIRYFKAGDRTGALAIIQALKRVLPRLWLRDLSAVSDQAARVKQGHYELWLAPGGQVKDH